MDTEIRVSTESRPWRRKFSRHSCRDLNLQPFNHESGSLTTEPPPSPVQMGHSIGFPFSLVSAHRFWLLHDLGTACYPFTN